MYANTCWGFLCLAVTFGLGALGLPADYAWLQPYLLYAAPACGLVSVVLFCSPLAGLFFTTTVATPKPNIGAAELFSKIIEQSKWAKRTIKSIDISGYFYPPKFDETQKSERALSYKLSNELHDHLRQGTISAWGKFSKNDGDSTPERLINADEWDDIWLSFDRRSLTSVPQASCAYSDIDRSPNLHYVQVRLCEKQVLKLYPLSLTKRKMPFVAGASEIAYKKV
jgi:hypothetical protein